MEPMLDGEDFGFIQDALQEMAGLTDRLVQIKRFIGFTGGTLDGVAPTEQFNYFDLMASVDSVSAIEVANSGGMLTLGDLKLSVPIDVREKTETPQQGDVLLFEGFNWYMKGKPERIFVAGLEYTVSNWYRT